MRFIVLLIFFISCSKEPLFKPLGEESKVTKVRESLENQEKLGLLNIGLQWIDGPNAIGEGENIFKIRFWNPSKSTIYGPYTLPQNKVCVLLWMKMSDGSEHGTSPVTIKIEHNDDGDILVVSDAYFVMNGQWQIRVRTVQEGTRCKATKDYEFLDEVIFAVNIN